MELTVVIPTYQRRAEVMRLLGSLDPPSGTEVVVVVDGSSDGTAEALRALRPTFSLRVVEQAHSGVAAARNRGMDVAVTDWIVFLDDDMVCAPGFLHALAEAWGTADVVQARVLLGDWVSAGPAADEAARWLGERHDALCAGRFTSSTVLFWATGVRGATVREIGGFDESFDIGEDVDLAYRLLMAGSSVRYAPAAVATTGWRTLPAPALARAQERGAIHARLVTRHPGLAVSLFSDPLQRSRLHRAVGRVVLTLPSAARLLRPVTARLTRFTRGWQLARAFAYWCGVADARAGAGPPGPVALTERVIEPRPQARLGRAVGRPRCARRRRRRRRFVSRVRAAGAGRLDLPRRLGLRWRERAGERRRAAAASRLPAGGARAGCRTRRGPRPRARPGARRCARPVARRDSGLDMAPRTTAIAAAGRAGRRHLLLLGGAHGLLPRRPLRPAHHPATVVVRLAGRLPTRRRDGTLASAVRARNPAAGVLEGLRQALAVGTLPDARMLCATTASTMSVVVAGYWLLKRIEPGIVDVV